MLPGTSDAHIIMDPVIAQSFRLTLDRIIRNLKQDDLSSTEKRERKLLLDLMLDTRDDLSHTLDISLTKHESALLYKKLNSLGEFEAGKTSVPTYILQTQHLYRALVDAMLLSGQMKKRTAPKWLDVKPSIASYVFPMPKAHHEHLSLRIGHILDDAAIMDYIHLTRADEPVLKTVRRQINHLLVRPEVTQADATDVFDLPLSLEEHRVVSKMLAVTREIGLNHSHLFPQFKVTLINDYVTEQLRKTRFHAVLRADKRDQ